MFTTEETTAAEWCLVCHPAWAWTHCFTNTKLLKIRADDRLHTDGFLDLKLTLYTSSPAITSDLQQLSHAFKLGFYLTTVKVVTFTAQNLDLDTSEPRERLLCTDN